MSALSLQQLLFREVRKRIPKHSSLELELSRILGKDFVEVLEVVNYQNELSLNDAKKIADYYSFSLDTLSNHQPSTIPFRFRAFDYNLQSMGDYFYTVLTELRNVEGWGPRRIFYAANDFPIFTLFQFPDLAAFKVYFWGSAIYDLPTHRNRKFALDGMDKMSLKLGERAWKQYIKIPSIEIWSMEIVDNVLHQFDYVWNHGYFEKKSDAKRVLTQMLDLLNHVQKQAVQGRKYHPNKEPFGKENFKLYFNDISISNNTILYSSENMSVGFILQNALNYLVTDSYAFCLGTEVWLQKMAERSTLISIHNEKSRNRFFDTMRAKVEASIAKYGL